MLQSSGKLLVKSHRGMLFAGVPKLAGFRARALFATQPRPGWGLGREHSQWSEATPLAGSAPEHPWDRAHRVAAAHGYQHFIEPDIWHEVVIPAAQKWVNPGAGPLAGWPPYHPVSPAWHLESSFTGFLAARRHATGAGVRVACLDTGYWPEQLSTPRNMRPDLGYNFAENNTNTVDPGQGGFLANPGHGTQTAALLAGAKVELRYAGIDFSGEIGGAPEAEVIPVRVGPAVVQFFASAMAQALAYALAPRGDAALCCDVVNVSLGGAPSSCWADAVNELYDAGVVVVAASGDNYEAGLDLPTRSVVYPSAFNRVITATGATYDGTAYATSNFGEMQANWGPDRVMRKAVAGFAPNVVSMQYRSKTAFTMNGNGTSVTTPQVAAACALWLERYRADYPRDWRRVEACRLALFTSAQGQGRDPDRIGRGTVSAAAMLDPQLNARIRGQFDSGTVQPEEADSANGSFWRMLFDLDPAHSTRDAMYDLEVAQALHHSQRPELVRGVRAHQRGDSLAPSHKRRLRALLAAEPDLSPGLAAQMSK